MPRGQVALGDQLLVRLEHGVARQLQARRKCAGRRQLFSRPKPPFENPGANGLGEPPVCGSTGIRFEVKDDVQSGPTISLENGRREEPFPRIRWIQEVRYGTALGIPLARSSVVAP